MTAPRTRQIRGAIRPLEPFRDLEQVVELITVSFGDRLDPAGKATLARMRRFARGGPLAQWLWAFLGKATVAPGLVWAENHRIVGNVSLRRAQGEDGYLIGNVVVHPDWRRRGIARALMKAVIHRLSRHGTRWVGLEVRADNKAARQLYEGLQFEEVGRTLHLLRPADLARETIRSPSLSMRRARGRDASALVDLMHMAIPKEQRPLLEIREADYRPSWKGTLEQWLRGRREAWWVAESGDEIHGAVRAIQKPGRFPNQLEVLIHPDHGERLASALAKQGTMGLRGLTRKPIEISLPRATEPLVKAFEEGGFRRLRVLVQMKRSLKNTFYVPVEVRG